MNTLFGKYLHKINISKSNKVFDMNTLNSKPKTDVNH